MPNLRLVTGTLDALEAALADAVRAARGTDPLAPVTVLVGQTLLKRYLPRMLAQRGVGHINVRFVLPDELAARLAPGGGAARMSPAQERLLVRLVTSDAGSYFGAIVRGDGFTRELLRLFREFERAGFTPESLGAAFGEAGLDGRKFAELAGMFARYVDRRREAGLSGVGDFYAARDARSFEGPLFIYGLWSPSALQLSLIGDIAAEAECVAFLPGALPDIEASYEAFRTWMVERGFVAEQATSAPSGIQALADRLFIEPDGSTPAEGVELISAANTVREVWEAARTCLAWGRDGIAFHEIAVVYRNSDPYRGLVAEIFHEAGLSDHTYIHQGRPLSEHPLGRRLIALLELIADDAFSRQRVMEFVTETRVPQATRERYERFRPAEWDAFTREAGVIEGIEQWRSRLARLAEEKKERAKDERFQWLAEHASRVEVLSRFVDDLHKKVLSHPQNASWQAHLRSVRDIASNYAQGVEPLLDALADLEELSSIQQEVTFDQFLQAVRDDLERRDVSDVLGEPKREFGRRGIAVLDASSLRHMRFRAVYLLGVSERAWPPPKRPDPLLLEHERAAVNKAAESQFLTLRTTPDEEALTFHLAVQAARERLVVSYARAEASGGGRSLPSHFFRGLAQAIEGRGMRVADVEDAACVRRLAAGRLAHDDLMMSVTDAEYDRGLIRSAIYEGRSGVIQALARFDQNNQVRTGGAIERAVHARRSRWSRGLTAYDGVMVSAEAADRAASLVFARSSPVSPSRLEMYAECPYRYFMRYGLGVESMDEPEVTERIDALERGSMIHEVLEQFLKELGRGDLPAEHRREAHVARLLDIAREAGEERERRGVTGRPLIWELDRRKINEDLVRWYDKEITEGDYESMLPGAFELGFGGVTYGFGEEDPLSSSDALTVELAGRTILLQGRIDRVDFDDARTRFRVIDYKTGRHGDKAAFDKGRALQLPLYLLAAAQILGVDQEIGEAQYYYCTSKGQFRRTKLESGVLAERHAEFEQVLETIAGGVDGGYFAPNPGKGAYNCTYCDYRLVCDAGVERLSEMKKQEPRGAAFIAMQDIT
jgi:RecB family exonuclease